MQSYYGLVILACWIVFIGYWIYSAPKAKRTLSSGRFSVTGIVWRLAFIVVVIFIAKVQPHILSETFVSSNVWWGVLGCVLVVVGVGIAVWARYYLGRNWGMPMSVKENTDLVTGGPYHLVRHPIYTGMLLAILGSALVAGLWWFIVFFGAAGYFIFSFIQEEALMQKEFPHQYPQYKARTWALIPFVY